MKNAVTQIITENKKYLDKHFSPAAQKKLAQAGRAKTPAAQVENFIREYHQLALTARRARYSPAQPAWTQAVESAPGAKLNLLPGDCFKHLQALDSETLHLIVTSPPYYNAREYSQWKNINLYYADMEKILTESFRVLKNHRYFVLNIGDITGNDGLTSKSSWGNRRLPLSAYFTVMMERIGFTYVDDFIWDKGEVQSQRHKNPPYPLYTYPMNCYEHILFFTKNEMDRLKYPCPVCGNLNVNGNSYVKAGVKSWECKNPACTQKSLSQRGKRFSYRGIEMTALKTPENKISRDLLKIWRRDIVRLNPVIKINSKGENKKIHTAPFPEEIPAYAIKVLTGQNELVYDPFAGSMTTMIAALKLGRVGLGSEIDRAMLEKLMPLIKENYELNIIELPSTPVRRASKKNPDCDKSQSGAPE